MGRGLFQHSRVRTEEDCEKPKGRPYPVNIGTDCRCNGLQLRLIVTTGSVRLATHREGKDVFSFRKNEKIGRLL